MRFLALTALLPLAAAHFQLNYPAARGYDEDTLGNFPCGGQNSASSNRTSWPVGGGPIQLNMEHATTNVQILLGLGNDPNTAFNTVLVKTFTIDGIGAFCVADVPLPSGMTVSPGMNATIQVVSNNENGGGLYNCADITFTNTTIADLQGATCMNATGSHAVAYMDPNANANTTVVAGEPAATKMNAAAAVQSASWAALLAGAAAAAVLL